MGYFRCITPQFLVFVSCPSDRGAEFHQGAHKRFYISTSSFLYKRDVRVVYLYFSATF